MDDSKLKIADTQPLADKLRPELPVSYFLLTRNIELDKVTFNPTVKSTFYNTDSYIVSPFYKAISNIV